MRFLPGLLLLASPCLFAAKGRNWKTGKILDSRAARTYVQTGSTTVASASGTAISVTGTAETQIRNMTIESTELLIVGDEYVYVLNDSVEKRVGPSLHGSLGRAIANRKHGCRYIVGDNILYFQAKNNLFVRDPDGKECKLDIDRQERLQTTKP